MSKDLHRDLSQYDNMTSQELEELLRLDSEAPQEQGSDTERLLYIMELLSRRETGNSAQEAWKAFQRDYLPIEDDKPVRKPLRLYRWIALAAALALLIAIPVAAFGWQDIVSAVAKWTKDTFSFVSSEDTDYTSPSPNILNNYSSLQEALAAAGLRDDMLPVWIPERFELDYITVNKTPVQKNLGVFYCYGENSLNIIVQTRVNNAPSYMENDEGLLEIYRASGREFYIFRNLDTVVAAWIDGSYECHISGDLTVEELKQMLDSINSHK